MGYAKVTLMSFCNNRVKLQKKRLITNGPVRKRHHLISLTMSSNWSRGPRDLFLILAR